MCAIHVPHMCPIIVGQGRDPAAYRNHIAAAAGGVGTLLLLTGEAGIGKSRLLRALADRAERDGFATLIGVCQEQGRDLPLAPFRDLVRQALHGPRGAAFADLLDPERAIFARLLPEFGAADPAPALPPEQEKHRLFEAFVRLFARMAGRAPLLIAIEDIHWADEMSRELVGLLPRRLAAARVLIVVTARSDEPTHTLAHWLATVTRLPMVARLPLAPLSDAEVGQMIAAMLPTPVPAAVRNAIATRAEGNPLAVEQLVHATAHAIAGGQSAATVAARHVPASIAEIVIGRLDRLPPEARAAAEGAAVIGRPFAFAALQWVMGWGEATTLAALRELIAAYLLVETESEGTRAFTFRHALTRDAIDARLLGPERLRLHRRFADALRDGAGGWPAPSESELSHHCFAAEEWEAALLHCTRAGTQAQALYAPQAAAEHFSRALVAATRLGASTTAIVMRRAQAYEWMGDLQRALDGYESVRAQARTAGDRQAEWQAITHLSAAWGSRDHPRGIALCEEALTLARTMDDRAPLAQNLLQRGAYAALYGRPTDARAYLDEARAIFASLGAHDGVAHTLERLGVTTIIGGDLVRGAAHLREAVAHFRALDDRRGLIRCLVEITQRVATLQGDWLVPETAPILDAIADGEEALALSRASAWRYGEAYSNAFLAMCAGAAGDYARALPWAEQALAFGEETGTSSHAFLGHGALSMLCLDLLALHAALRHLQRSLALARELGSHHYVQDVIGFTVTAYIARGEIARAASLLAEALTPQTPAQTLSERRLWLAQAELSLAQGDAAQALGIVDNVIASTPNIGTRGAGAIPRLAKLRGESLIALGRYAEAEADLTAAAETAIVQGARPLLWRIHLARGRLYRATGRIVEAGAAFTTVREIVADLALGVPDTRVRATFVRAATARIPGIYPLTTPAATRAGDGLTGRERAIVAAVARGASNREIADALFISEKTVEWHVGNCLRKRGCRTRAELAVWAVAAGVAPAPPTARDATATS